MSAELKPQTRSPENRFAWLCCALLVGIGLVLNRKVLGFDFLYLRDDDINIALNPYMGGISLARLKWMFTDLAYMRRYVPLGYLGFSASYEAGGLDPLAFHATSLLLYAANTMLVFAVVREGLGVFGEADGRSRWATGCSALAAGWWAFHPLRVETTAWASGNLYGQSTAFMLASAAAYLRTYSSSGRKRSAWFWAAAVGYAASVLTYPVALGAPFILVGLDWAWSRGNRKTFLRLLTEKTAFAVPMAGVFAATVAARYRAAAVYGSVPSLHDLPLLSRIAQSAYVACYYLWRPWWPTRLTPVYDTLAAVDPHRLVFVASMIGAGLLTAAALLAFPKRPLLTALWFGYLAEAAPFFGLTEKPHVTSDRYACLLQAIEACALAALLLRVRPGPIRAAATVAAVAAIALLARLTQLQLPIWANDRIHHVYIVSHLSDPLMHETFESRRQLLEYFRGNEHEAEEAVARALKANPSSPGYRTAEGIIEQKRKQQGYYGSVPLLAILHQRLALRFAHAGELEEANDHLSEALRLDDHFYQAAYDRAIVLLQLGRCPEALRSYLWAARWGGEPLGVESRRAFLASLEGLAKAEGQLELATAARAARSRLPAAPSPHEPSA